MVGEEGAKAIADTASPGGGESSYWVANESYISLELGEVGQRECYQEPWSMVLATRYLKGSLWMLT